MTLDQEFQQLQQSWLSLSMLFNLLSPFLSFSDVKLKKLARMMRLRGTREAFYNLY